MDPTNYDPIHPSPIFNTAHRFREDGSLNPELTGCISMSFSVASPHTQSEWVFPHNPIAGISQSSFMPLETLTNDIDELFPSLPPLYRVSHTNPNSPLRIFDLNTVGLEPIYEGPSSPNSGFPNQDLACLNGMNSLQTESALFPSNFYPEIIFNQDRHYSDFILEGQFFLGKLPRPTSISVDKPRTLKNRMTTSPPLLPPPPPTATPPSSPIPRKRKVNRDHGGEVREEMGYIRSRDSRGKTVYLCLTCPGYTSKTHGDITRHLESLAHKPRSYKCDICGDLLTRKDALKRHIEGHQKIGKSTKGRVKRAKVMP